MKSQIEELSLKVNESEAARNAAIKECSKLADDLEEINSQKESINLSFSESNASLDFLEKKIEVLKTESQAEIEGYLVKLKATELSRDAALEECLNLKKQVEEGSLEKSLMIEDLKSKVQEHQLNILKIQKEHSIEKAETSEALQALQTEKSNVVLELNRVQGELSALLSKSDDELKEMMRSNDHLKSQIDELTLKVMESEAARDTAIRNCSKLSEDLEEITSQKESISLSFSESNASLDVLEKKMEVMKTGYQVEIEGYLVKLKATELSRDEALEEYSKVKKDFTQEISEKQSIIEELKSNVQEYQLNILKIQKEHSIEKASREV